MIFSFFGLTNRPLNFIKIRNPFLLGEKTEEICVETMLIFNFEKEGKIFSTEDFLICPKTRPSRIF